MKILSFLGFLVLLTTSLIINGIPGQVNAVPISAYHPQPVIGPTFIILALFLGFLSFLKAPEPKCSSEYTLYSTKCGEFCYRFDNKNCISWTAARTTCQGEGGELLEPDVCTYPFFHGLVRENRGTCADTWIGGFRDLPMLNYTTVRGNPLPDNFQWWGSNQPSKRNTQACVEMTPGRGFLMNDDECADLNGYICQKYFKH